MPQRTIKASVHSKSVARALSSNRECQRLHGIEQTQLNSHRHKARCGINSEIHQLRAEMYKLRVKTPNLKACLEGRTLDGLDNSPESQPVCQVFPNYEFDNDGKLRKGKKPTRKLCTRQSTTSTSSGRSSRASVPTPEETRAKIVDFFERNKDLFNKPQDKSSSTTWTRGSKSAHSFYQSGNSQKETTFTRPQTGIFVTNITNGPERKSENPDVKRPGTTPTFTRESVRNKQTVNKEDLANMIQAAWKSSMSSSNPYQAFFKPETGTLRLAHQVVLVSRKLQNIKESRENKKIKECEKQRLLDEQKKKETAKKEKRMKWFVDSDDFD